MPSHPLYSLCTAALLALGAAAHAQTSAAASAAAGTSLRHALTSPGLPPVAGVVFADDYPSLQAAVDALGETGGEVRFGAKAYLLEKTVLVKHRIRFQGVMDSKVRNSVTRIGAAPNFKGEWLFETVPVPARANPDLNKDLFFFDLNMTGSDKISGIRAYNADGLRMERCRLAGMKNGLLVTQVTDKPKPWHWDISPGAVFINNCIFRCNGTAIQLEYSTQNRIYSNWFVSGCGVALHLKNSDKTWFFANEINTFGRAAILLEDDGQPGNQITDVILSHNWMNAADPSKKYLELLPNGKTFRRVRFHNNILDGNGSADTGALLTENGSCFHENAANRPGFSSNAAGDAEAKAGATEVVIAHGLYRKPDHVSVTFRSEPPVYWVTDTNEKTFTVRFTGPAKAGSFSWNAMIRP